MKKCPYCSAQIADDSLFCEACGKKQPQGRVCSQCAMPVNDGDVFCGNCGHKIEEEVLEAAPAAEAEIGAVFEIPSPKLVIGIVVICAVLTGGVLLYKSHSVQENLWEDKDGTKEVAAYYDAGAETDYEDAGQTAEEEAVQVAEFYGTGEEYERTTAGSSISFLSADDVYGHLANKRFRESTEQVELRYNGSCELYINGEWNAPPFHVVSLQSKQATIMYNSPMDGTMRLIVRIEGRDIEVQDPIDGTVYYQVKLRRY